MRVERGRRLRTVADCAVECSIKRVNRHPLPSDLKMAYRSTEVSRTEEAGKIKWEGGEANKSEDDQPPL